MLTKSAQQKGDRLEKFIADEFKKIDKFAYRRADSGSGKDRKEDVFTTLPFFIEAKHHKTLSVGAWWEQTLYGCPASKYPVLIYKTDYQEPVAHLFFEDLLSFLSGSRVQGVFRVQISLKFSDFMKLLSDKVNHEK